MYFGFRILLLLVVIYLIAAQPPAPTALPVRKMWRENDRNIYPNPHTYHQGCNRPGKSWICDANKVFRQGEVDEIESKLMELRDVAGGCPCHTNTTSCSYLGLPVIITIMKDFKSSDGTSVEALMHSYGHHFLSSWKIDDCDDGIAIVVRAETTTGDKKAQVIREYSTNSQELIDEKCRNYVASKSNSIYENGDVIAGLKIELDTYRKILMKESNCEADPIFAPPTVIMVVVLPASLTVTVIFIYVLIKRLRMRKSENARKYLNHSKKEYRDSAVTECSDSLANKNEEPWWM